MKNTRKRLLALLLCMVMCVSLLPAPALAEEETAGEIVPAEEAGSIEITADPEPEQVEAEEPAEGEISAQSNEIAAEAEPSR